MCLAPVEMSRWGPAPLVLTHPPCSQARGRWGPEEQGMGCAQLQLICIGQEAIWECQG